MKPLESILSFLLSLATMFISSKKQEKLQSDCSCHQKKKLDSEIPDDPLHTRPSDGKHGCCHCCNRGNNDSILLEIPMEERQAKDDRK
jgi:hypothetical protein